jgi:probable HAF family extracellular repeat protein
MRRLTIPALTALGLMGLASTEAAADPMFHATDLGQLVATGFNSAGQIVGGGLDTAHGAPPGIGSGGFFYNAYGPNAGTLYAFTNFQPTAINASGLILGSTTINNMGVFSYGTADGQVTPIQNVAPVAGEVNSINASGQTLVVESGPQSPGFSTSIYNPDGSHVNIGTPPGQSWFTGTGINDSGQVAGFTGAYDSTAQASLYSGGAFHSLGTLPGDAWSVAVGINNAGQVVGNSESFTQPVSHAFLYDGGTMKSLGTLGGSSSVATGISNTGEVYGYSTTADGSNHAFLYAGGQMIDLTKMLHSLTGPISQYAYYTIQGINDRNRMVVLAQNSSAGFHTFLLTPEGQPLPTAPQSVQVVPVTVGPYTPPAQVPAPEPSVLALFAMAVIAWGGRRGWNSLRRLIGPESGGSPAQCSGGGTTVR